MSYHADTLKKLGEQLGFDLNFGEDEQCCLIFDSRNFLSIKSQPSGWLFVGQLENGLDSKEKTFWQDLLALNLSLTQSRSGTICYEKTSDVLLYLHHLRESELSAHAAFTFLESYINQLEDIKGHLGFN